MSRYDVAIVGAGAAGIAAARYLHDVGRSVIVIEASDRIGGRAWTQTVNGMSLDLGCGWLHSACRNPLAPIAEANGFAVDRSPSAGGKQYHELGFTRAEQDSAHASWAAFQQRLETSPPVSDRAADALSPRDPWNAYANALSGYMNGACLDRLSVADYFAYENAAGSENWRIREGYGTLIASLLPRTALSLGNPVIAIDHGGSEVQITTRAGTISAFAVVVTVSTAVLAAGVIRFGPAVDAHLHAAANLPLICRWDSPTSCSLRSKTETMSGPTVTCSAILMFQTPAVIIYGRSAMGSSRRFSAGLVRRYWKPKGSRRHSPLRRTNSLAYSARAFDQNCARLQDRTGVGWMGFAGLTVTPGPVMPIAAQS